MKKKQLIKKFEAEMKKLGVAYFAPSCHDQFRVELGIAGNRGGHIYADFRSIIHSKRQLDEFIQEVKNLLKEVKHEREIMTKQGSDYWQIADNFV